MADINANEPVRIMFWAVPRSASTVFTKFMSFVDNVEVWQEPYVISHLFQNGWLSQRPKLISLSKQLYELYPEGKRGNLRPVETFTYESTKAGLERGAKDPNTKFIFVKDMAFTIHGHYEFMPQKVPIKHVFVIRHPHRYLTSNRAHVLQVLGKPADAPYEVADDLLMKTEADEMFELWKHVRENVDPKAPVIDSDQYLKAPEKILPKLFAEIGIPWKDSYLSWDASDDIVFKWTSGFEHILYDKMTQDQVFKKAFSSGKFHSVEKPIPKRDELHPDILDMVDHYMPGYVEMSKHLL
ncbi:uncharacterized protein [Apostichopus japonicus]|uniref:uncharacterized protein n=1 Tax=Stichopus japonicus TaxID=307972 RepID=UPI003AB3D1F5